MRARAHLAESAGPFQNAAQPGETGPAPCGKAAPQKVRRHDRPQPTAQQWAGIVPGHKIDLVARDSPHRIGMPLAQRGAAFVPRDGRGFVYASEAESRAAQPEIHIFEIRFEALFEQPHALEYFSAKK